MDIIDTLLFPGDEVLDNLRATNTPYDSPALNLEKLTMERLNRSELIANMSLIPTTDKPLWMNPAPIRTTTKRRTYGVLSIAQRHPRLFGWLTRK